MDKYMYLCIHMYAFVNVGPIKFIWPQQFTLACAKNDNCLVEWYHELKKIGKIKAVLMCISWLTKRKITLFDF